MPSTSSKWYHLTTAEKKAPTSSGYSRRRKSRQSRRSTSRRSHRSSANFRTVSSSEARRRFPVNSSEARRRIHSGTRKTAAALFGFLGNPKA